MKSWIRSRTVWFSFAVGLLGLFETTLASAPLDPQVSGFVTMGIGFATAVLRKLTTEPIG